MQVVKGAPSRLQWKLLPSSLELKVKLALVEFVAVGGPELIVVWGAVRSTVQLSLAGLASVFAGRSVARTWNVCAPAASADSSSGWCRLVKAALSRLHWKCYRSRWS